MFVFKQNELRENSKLTILFQQPLSSLMRTECTAAVLLLHVVF